MRRLLLASAFLLTLPGILPGAEAQDLQIYDFDLSADETLLYLDPNSQANVPFIFSDLSKDSSNVVAPGTGVSGPDQHITRFSVEYPGARPQDFQVVPPRTALYSVGGETYERTMSVKMGSLIQDEFIEFSLVAETQVPNGSKFRQAIDFAVISPGRSTLVALAAVTDTLAPDETLTFPLRLTNNALVPRTFTIEATDNPCDMQVAYERTAFLDGKSSAEYDVTIRAPADKFLYLSEICSLGFLITPTDEGAAKPVTVNVIVDGTYIDPVWAFYALAAVVALILLLLFLARRKAAIEEEILGKPQRPWTIPVERVYLEHLEQRDPRAAYVVRHFLMEEEYQSALLWYKSYKEATKGTRSKERIVVAAERDYERFQKKWEKKIAKPLKKADRFEAKLQKKLDRQAKTMVRKDRRKWKKGVAKLEKAVEARNAKALNKWEKQAAKAEKKGQPTPPRPEPEAPDLPPEPQLQKIELANHKWQKKADRKRRKMIKKQGNLEVKYEKKDARVLHKVQRKVDRIARKIDDPDFAAEHPLLAKD